MTTDERLDRIEKSIGEARQDLSTLAHDLGTLTRYVREFRTETIGRLEIIDSRLAMMAASIVSLEQRLPPMSKAILEFGEIVNRLQIEQSRIASLVQPAA
ncbi:MAG TPA: hypothetical protein VKU19_23065 [Bryobacteraceae bacterium]|nr:hypothetical protein [Bryobacteraceae bacterium]